MERRPTLAGRADLLPEDEATSLQAQSAKTPQGFPIKLCSLCRRLHTDPKILPCSHTFCKECLITWTSGKCPEASCTKVFADKMPKDKRSRESFVDGLPTDLVTKALAEMAQLLQKTNLCRGCRIKAAKSFCLDCFDFLCPSCVTVHDNLPSIAGVHKVEKLETLTPERLVEKRPVSCTVHPDRPAQLFCPEDGVFLCKACAISDVHLKVMKTQERIKELLEELKKKSGKTRGAKQKLDDVMEKLAQRSQALDEQSKVVLYDIDRHCDRLESALKDSRRLLKERALSDVTKAKGQVQVAMGKCLDVSKLFEAKKIFLERVRESFPTAFLNDIMDMLTSDDQEPYDIVGFSAENESVVPTLSTLNLAAVKTVETAVKDLDLEVNQVDPPVMVKKAAGDHTLNENRTVQTPRLETTSQKREVNQATTPYHVKRAVSVLDLGKGQFSTTSVASPTSAVVQVDMIAEDVDWWFTCGVLRCESVDQLTLPTTMYSGGINAVVFNKGVSVNKALTNVPAVRTSLYRLNRGAVVGLALDASNSLRLRVNRQDVVSVRDVSQPCFVFIELDKRYQQVITLPVQNYE